MAAKWPVTKTTYMEFLERAARELHYYKCFEFRSYIPIGLQSMQNDRALKLAQN